jgi:hypothetical protein
MATIKVSLNMRVRDYPLALKWLHENYKNNTWTTGITGFLYSESHIDSTIKQDDEGHFLHYDENEYREETLFYFDNPEMAMMFKLIWA